jgi:hypothetical protein
MFASERRAQAGESKAALRGKALLNTLMRRPEKAAANYQQSGDVAQQAKSLLKVKEKKVENSLKAASLFRQLRDKGSMRKALEQTDLAAAEEYQARGDVFKSAVALHRAAKRASASAVTQSEKGLAAERLRAATDRYRAAANALDDKGARLMYRSKKEQNPQKKAELVKAGQKAYLQAGRAWTSVATLDREHSLLGNSSAAEDFKLAGAEPSAARAQGKADAEQAIYDAREEARFQEIKKASMDAAERRVLEEGQEMVHVSYPGRRRTRQRSGVEAALDTAIETYGGYKAGELAGGLIKDALRR